MAVNPIETLCAKIDGRTAIGIAKALLSTFYKKEKLANCNPEGFLFDTQQ